MRNLLLILSLFSTLLGFAQNATITIKAQGQTVVASLGNDNTNKVLILNTAKKPVKTDKVVAYNNNTEELKEWKRSFTIVDKADAEIITFKAGAKSAMQQISLTDIITKLKKNEEYFLYTIALPKDPARAAVIRVRRILICVIRVK